MTMTIYIITYWHNHCESVDCRNETIPIHIHVDRVLNNYRLVNRNLFFLFVIIIHFSSFPPPHPLLAAVSPIALNAAMTITTTTTCEPTSATSSTTGVDPSLLTLPVLFFYGNITVCRYWTMTHERERRETDGAKVNNWQAFADFAYMLETGHDQRRSRRVIVAAGARTCVFLRARARVCVLVCMSVPVYTSLTWLNNT